MENEWHRHWKAQNDNELFFIGQSLRDAKSVQMIIFSFYAFDFLIYRRLDWRVNDATIDAEKWKRLQ